jgi:hypothetical protein
MSLHGGNQLFSSLNPLARASKHPRFLALLASAKGLSDPERWLTKRPSGEDHPPMSPRAKVVPHYLASARIMELVLVPGEDINSPTRAQIEPLPGSACCNHKICEIIAAMGPLWPMALMPPWAKYRDLLGPISHKLHNSWNIGGHQCSLSVKFVSDSRYRLLRRPEPITIFRQNWSPHRFDMKMM